MTEPTAPIRVLLVEDSDVYRDSLVFLLETRPGLEVVAAVADGAAALRAYREHTPDVVVLDYRLPDVDGATVAAELREAAPHAAVVFLSASAGSEEYDAASSAGAALVRKDEGIEALVRAVRAAAGGDAMNLTSENTAIVLDSTSDYPDAPARFPNMRFVPLYVRFGDETYRDYLELGPADFYEKLRASAVTPATAQPTPQDFVTAYEELAGYERIYSLHVTAKLSGTFQSAELAAQEIGGDKVRVVDSKTASLAIAMLAHAIQRRLARGTTDEEISALVDRFYAQSNVLFTVETLEFLQRGGRIGKAQAIAGSLLNLRPVLSVEDGVVIPVARVRGKQKALAEFERRFVEATIDGPGLRIAIAHANAEEWVGTLSELAWRVRPKAEIEFTSTLGAVVGTHVGPGAVGFFWFQDDEHNDQTHA